MKLISYFEDVLVELVVVGDGENDGVDLLEELDVVGRDVAEVDLGVGLEVGHRGLVKLRGIGHLRAQSIGGRCGKLF